jgi:hypothetical protein
MQMPENAYCDSGGSPPTALEPFVSAQEAARFLAVTPRYLLELARRGLDGAYPMGTGKQRRIWRFRLSELAAAIISANERTTDSQARVKIPSGSLRAEKRIK